MCFLFAAGCHKRRICYCIPFQKRSWWFHKPISRFIKVGSHVLATISSPEAKPQNRPRTGTAPHGDMAGKQHGRASCSRFPHATLHLILLVASFYLYISYMRAPVSAFYLLMQPYPLLQNHVPPKGRQLMLFLSPFPCWTISHSTTMIKSPKRWYTWRNIVASPASPSASSSYTDAVPMMVDRKRHHCHQAPNAEKPGERSDGVQSVSNLWSNHDNWSRLVWLGFGSLWSPPFSRPWFCWQKTCQILLHPKKSRHWYRLRTAPDHGCPDSRTLVYRKHKFMVSFNMAMVLSKCSCSFPYTGSFSALLLGSFSSASVPSSASSPLPLDLLLGFGT